MVIYDPVDPTAITQDISGNLQQCSAEISWQEQAAHFVGSTDLPQS
jgi:hypothetical protein